MFPISDIIQKWFFSSMNLLLLYISIFILIHILCFNILCLIKSHLLKVQFWNNRFFAHIFEAFLWRFTFLLILVILLIKNVYSFFTLIGLTCFISIIQYIIHELSINFSYVVENLEAFNLGSLLYFRESLQLLCVVFWIRIIRFFILFGGIFIMVSWHLCWIIGSLLYLSCWIWDLIDILVIIV